MNEYDVSGWERLIRSEERELSCHLADEGESEMYIGFDGREYEDAEMDTMHRDAIEDMSADGDPHPPELEVARAVLLALLGEDADLSLLEEADVQVHINYGWASWATRRNVV